MSDLAIGVLAFICIFGGAVFGMYARTILPEHHLSDATKDVVKLGMGLVGTMTALILGLLLASARSEYDVADTSLRHGAVDVIKLDRTLARYGPETVDIRQLIRNALVQRLELTWPQDSSKAVQMDAPGMLAKLEAIEDGIQKLTPKNDVQRWLQSQALQLSGEVLGSRLLVLTRPDNSASLVFLVVVIGWLAIVFASFGLFAPRNLTVALTLGVCAASVATALFLILELGSPFGGTIKLSDAPLRYALTQVGR